MAYNSLSNKLKDKFSGGKMGGLGDGLKHLHLTWIYLFKSPAGLTETFVRGLN